MSIKNYKVLFWGLILGWTALCFVLFGQNLQSETVLNKAESSIDITRSFFDEYSKQLKFKLGQWAYNYELKQSKGLAFDQQAFMDSDFDLIGFYQVQEGEGLRQKWTKSKDFAPKNLPESIDQRLSGLNVEELKEEPYQWFAGLDKQGQSVMTLGFYVNDSALGRGMIVGGVDLKTMPYANLKAKTYILDEDGRYLLHPQTEYLAQKSLLPFQTMTQGELTLKGSDYWLSEPITAGSQTKVIFREEKQSLVSLLGFALLVTLLGLGLLAGLPLILREDDIVAEPNYKASEPMAVAQSDIDLAGYESVLKIQSLREQLNKMYLMSSSLKGRLDLIRLNDFDEKLVEEVQSEFAQLDQSIDLAFSEASDLGDLADTENAFENKPADFDSDADTKQKESKKTQSSSEGIGPKETNIKMTEKKSATKTVENENQPAFEITEGDIDLDFADSLSLSLDEAETDIEPEEKNTEDSKAETKSSAKTVVKQASDSHSSDLVSESLEEAKFALDSLGNEEDFLMDIEDGVESVDISLDDDEKETAQVSSAKPSGGNDWSKVIADLTEELNNLDLDFEEDEEKNIVQASETSEEDQDDESIKPPRPEL